VTIVALAVLARQAARPSAVTAGDRRDLGDTIARAVGAEPLR